MTRDQIIELLQVVSTYDGRKLDQMTIAAWGEAAKRGNWTPEKAAEAVHQHFATQTVWLMPGHVTEGIKRPSRQPANARDLLAVEGPTPASEQTRAAVMAQIRRLAESKSL